MNFENLKNLENCAVITKDSISMRDMNIVSSNYDETIISNYNVSTDSKPLNQGACVEKRNGFTLDNKMNQNKNMTSKDMCDLVRDMNRAILYFRLRGCCSVYLQSIVKILRKYDIKPTLRLTDLLEIVYVQFEKLTPIQEKRVRKMWRNTYQCSIGGVLNKMQYDLEECYKVGYIETIKEIEKVEESDDSDVSRDSYHHGRQYINIVQNNQGDLVAAKTLCNVKWNKVIHEQDNEVFEPFDLLVSDSSDAVSNDPSGISTAKPEQKEEEKSPNIIMKAAAEPQLEKINKEEENEFLESDDEEREIIREGIEKREKQQREQFVSREVNLNDTIEEYITEAPTFTHGRNFNYPSRNEKYSEFKVELIEDKNHELVPKETIYNDKKWSIYEDHCLPLGNYKSIPKVQIPKNTTESPLHQEVFDKIRKEPTTYERKKQMKYGDRYIPNYNKQSKSQWKPKVMKAAAESQLEKIDKKDFDKDGDISDLQIVGGMFNQWTDRAYDEDEEEEYIGGLTPEHEFEEEPMMHETYDTHGQRPMGTITSMRRVGRPSGPTRRGYRMRSVNEIPQYQRTLQINPETQQIEYKTEEIKQPEAPIEEEEDFNPFEEEEQKEREQKQENLTRQQQQVQQLNLGLLSDSFVSRVNKQNINIERQRFNTITLTFRYPRDELNAITLDFDAQLRLFVMNLKPLIEQLVTERIVYWKMFIVFDAEEKTGTLTSQFRTSYEDMYELFFTNLERTIESYAEDLVIQKLVIVLGVTNTIAGAISSRIADRKLMNLKVDYGLISPKTKFNCLWVAICIAAYWKKNKKLIFNVKLQNQEGHKLKKKVGTENKKAGRGEDIQKVANYLHMNISLWDTEKINKTYIGTSISNRENEHIHIALTYGHYVTMIDKKELTKYKIDLKPVTYDELQIIESGYKKKDARKIISYDIESYKERINPDSEKEHNQIAYAIGWGFIISNEDEERYCNRNGYQLIDSEIKENPVKIAYKQILGENCLTKAMDEWMENQIFHKAVFYAHNGGKFDTRLILGQSDILHKPDNRYSIDNNTAIELNGRLINLDFINKIVKYDSIMKTKKGKRKSKQYHMISLRDSLPMFGPDSKLSKLCKELKVRHGKLEDKIAIHEQMYKDTWEKLWQEHNMTQYLIHDVLGLLEVMETFAITVYDMTKGDDEYGIHITNINTGASLAKKYYLKNFYDETNYKLAIYSLSKNMDQFVRKSFNGGRCENFIQGECKDQNYYYDFTSLYPYAALDNIPVGKPRWILDPEAKIGKETRQRKLNMYWNKRIIQRQITNTKGFWQVKIRSPLAAQGNMTNPLQRKPLFGIKEGGKYLFRWFKEWTEIILYEDEILKAIDLKLDYEFEPINGMIFNSSPVLRECMLHLFEMKAEAKRNKQPVMSKAWKVIINSLFGVWGLKVNDRDGIELSNPENSNWALDLAMGKLTDVEQIGNFIITRRAKDLEVKDHNVAIASAITSRARMYLYELMCDIQDNGGELRYCDTDSLITNYCIENNKDLSNKWIGPTHGEALGSLKNEIHECYEKHPNLQKKHYFDKAVIISPKLYILCAESEQIVKKAHKGYRENIEKGDIVTYERMRTLVNLELNPEDRIMQQQTLQWIGSNADLLKGNIGMRIVQRIKRIKATLNKGILQGTHIIPFIESPEPIKIDFDKLIDDLVKTYIDEQDKPSKRKYPKTKLDSIKDIEWWGNQNVIKDMPEANIKWVDSNEHYGHNFGLGDRNIVLDILEEKRRKPSEPCYLYEVFRGNCRLYCDIDCENWKEVIEDESKTLIRILQLICTIAEEEFQVTLDTSRFRIGRSTTEKKFSFHILHLDHIFETPRHQHHFWSKVMERSNLCSDMISPVKHASIIDNIYKINSSLRTILSQKPGKQIQEPIWFDDNGKIVILDYNDIDLSEYLINMENEDFIEYSSLSREKDNVKKHKRSKATKINAAHSTTIPKTILDQISEFKECEDYRANKYLNECKIEMVRIRPGYCPCCIDKNGNPEYHDNRDAFITLNKEGEIKRFGCFKNSEHKINLSR